MKKIFLFFIFPLIIYAGDGLEYTISGIFGYRSLNVKIGDTDATLNYTQAGVNTTVLIDEAKVLYFGGTYGKMSFGDEMVFNELPISVSTKFSKPAFSVFAGGYFRPYSFSEDFAIFLNPEFSYNVSSHSWDISQSPYLEGSVDGKIYYIEGKLGLLLMYEGNETFEPYFGFYFDYYRGNVKFREKFNDLEGIQEEILKPKLPIMVTAGTNVYYGEKFSAGLSLGLLNGITATGFVGITF